MLKKQIEQDLKQALLNGDKLRTEVLRGLKSAILYEEVAKHLRDTGLDDGAILMVIKHEAKKRAESAELYEKAGANDRAQAERTEQAILNAYLPAQLTDEALTTIVEDALAQLGDSAGMGQVIGVVRQKVGAQADGGRIAAIVKNKLLIN